VDIYSGPKNHLVECKLQPLICPKENRLQTLEGQAMRIEPVEWPRAVQYRFPEKSVAHNTKTRVSRPAERAKK